MEHEPYQEWIDLDADGELGADEGAQLASHLAGCEECGRQAERARALVSRLGSARIPVRAGFAREVLAALDPAPWEARTLRAWRLPVALILAVGGASATLFGVGAARLDPGSGTAGALFSLLDLMRAAFVAGSGVVTASWLGIGSAVGEWLGGSPANWVAAATLAAGANYLLYRLLHSRRRVATESWDSQPRP